MKIELLVGDHSTIVSNSSFNDDLIDFAYKHNFNIKYKNINHSNFEKDVLKLIKLGYTFNFEKETIHSFYGVEDRLCGLFIHPVNKLNHDDKNERKIITECINYLLCLSRLVSPSDAISMYNFKFDGYIIDFLKNIKDNYSNNTLNTNDILKSDTFKNIQIELNRLCSEEEE